VEIQNSDHMNFQGWGIKCSWCTERTKPNSTFSNY